MEETEYEENFDASKVTIVYDGNEEQLPQGNGDLTEQKLGKSEAAVWENIRISGQNMITVSLSNNPFENEVRYGLIMPDGKLRYVYGSGMCSHAFEVGSAGTYKIYVEIIYVFLTIFLYLLKCPQSLILSALRAFCFCGKPHISRSIFLYFRYQAWLKSW